MNKIKTIDIQNHSIKSTIIDYILMFLIIMMSSNPYIKEHYILFLFVSFGLIVIKERFNVKKMTVTKKEFLIIILFFLIELIHVLIFQDIRWLNVFRITFLGYIACLIVKTTNTKFIGTYVNIIFFLSILAIITYPLLYNKTIYFAFKEIADTLFPLTKDFNKYYTPTLLFVTLDPGYLLGNGLYRNPGFAWEAGGFAIFVNIALWFNLFLLRKTNVFSKKNIIFIIAIATTLSTTGYIVMFFILMTFFIQSTSKRLTQIIYLIIFTILSITIFQNQEFLSKKINNQLEHASKSQNRFGSAILDINDWKERPLFGWSRNDEIIKNVKQYTIYDLHRPNGLTNLLRSYGILYFLIVMLLLFNSSKQMCLGYHIEKPKITGLLFFTIIIISAFSQVIFDFIFFKSLLFLGGVILNYNKDNLLLNESIYHNE